MVEILVLASTVTGLGSSTGKLIGSLFLFRSESGLDPLVQVLEVLITSELNMNHAAPGKLHLSLLLR